MSTVIIESIVLVVLANAIKKGKKLKGLDVEVRSQIIPVHRLHGRTKRPNQRAVELVRALGKVLGYKINEHKLMALMYTTLWLKKNF